MAAHSPLVAGCSPGNEPFKFLESDVPLGLSKVAADYTLYAAHGGNVVPPGVQLALERAKPRMRSNKTLMLWSSISLNGPACQKIGRFRWPFSLAYRHASW